MESSSIKRTALAAALASSVVVGAPSHAEPVECEFVTWGGNGDDQLNSVVSSPDGYLIGHGNTYSYGTGDVDALLLKFDRGMNVEWARRWGGSAEDDSEGFLCRASPLVLAPSEETCSWSSTTPKV